MSIRSVFTESEESEDEDQKPPAVANDSQLKKHKEMFHIVAYKSKVFERRSKRMSREEWLECIRILKQLKDLSSNQRKEYFKSNVKAKNAIESGFIYMEEPGEDCLYKTNSDGVPKKCVNIMQTFEIIHKAHILSWHGSWTKTRNKLYGIYYNITQAEIKAFCDTCPVCAEEKSARKRMRWEVDEVPSGKIVDITDVDNLKSIEDRVIDVDESIPSPLDDKFMVKIIDFHDDPQLDSLGIEQRFLMYVKCHQTDKVFLRPIPNKDSTRIAEEIYKIMGTTGFPLFYQGDLLEEALTEEVVTVLQTMQHPVRTVKGPVVSRRQQEAFERNIETVKDSLLQTVQKYDRVYPREEHSWLSVYTDVAATINSTGCRRSAAKNPTEAVMLTNIRPIKIKTEDYL